MISEHDAPLAVYRPTRRVLFTFLNLLLAGLGVFLLILGGDMFADAFLRPGKNVPLVGHVTPLIMLLGGVLALGYTVPNLVLFRRVSTTVYCDRLEISTVWRTITLPLAEISGAVRQENSEQIDSIVLMLKRGGWTQDVAVQFIDEAEQNKFIALINRLVAEQQS